VHGVDRHSTGCAQVHVLQGPAAKVGRFKHNAPHLQPARAKPKSNIKYGRKYGFKARSAGHFRCRLHCLMHSPLSFSRLLHH